MRRTKPWAAAVVGALVVAAAGSTVRAWNETGHMTAALIAYRQLTPAVRTKVDDLLKQHPAFATLSAGAPANFDAGAWVFMQAATWPDAIRDRNNPGHDDFDPDAPANDPDIPPGLTHRGVHDIEHFVDFPYEDGATGKPPASRTVLTALPTWVATLEDTQKPAPDRAVALSWMLHLFGDIHQPLHCATRFTADFPGGDRGGNSLLVNVGGRTMPLHTYWDDLLGRSQNARTLQFLADQVTQANGRDDLPELSNTQFQAWAHDESFEDAVAFAYLNGQIPGVPEKSGGRPDPVPVGYDHNARALAQKRIALAGYRLADQLNRSLGAR